MSLREVDRFKVIQATSEGLLAQWRAAERLDLTARQVLFLIAPSLLSKPHSPVSKVYCQG